MWTYSSESLLSLLRAEYAVPCLKGVGSIWSSKNLLIWRQTKQGLKLAQWRGQTTSSKTNLDPINISESSATDINRMRTETASSKPMPSHKSQELRCSIKAVYSSLSTWGSTSIHRSLWLHRLRFMPVKGLVWQLQRAPFQLLKCFPKKRRLFLMSQQLFRKSLTPL